MIWGELQDLLSPMTVRSVTCLLEVKLAPYQTAIFVPVTDPTGIGPYRRIKP